MTRSAAEIGAGLAPARDARPIAMGERIHVVGAAGAGASGAALLAAGAGADVSGCDAGGPSPYTPPLEVLGIPLAWRHDASHVTTEPHPNRLAVTKALTSITPDHPELAAARAAGIRLEPWQQVVADAASGRTLVAVAGTHGKSTTAGWLVSVLVDAGLDPSAFVGALLPSRLASGLTGGLPATARQGGGAAFVVEADEYAGNFDPYLPRVAVLTSLEWDHPDVFADLDAVSSAIAGWLSRAADRHGEAAVLVANEGNPGVSALVERLDDWPGRLVVTALADGSGTPDANRVDAIAAPFAVTGRRVDTLLGRIVESTPETTAIELRAPALLSKPITAPIRLAGHANAENALCVAAAALVLGTPAASLDEYLSGFEGVGRRLERKGVANDVVVYDDYGHHPTAIRETIGAVRQREPGRRIWAVYEPLTYHRTAAFLDGFADALATADAVAVADIWAGRDPDTSIASAEGLARAVSARRPELTVGAPGSVEATADWLAAEVRPGEAVLVMGGGRSYVIGERLLARLGA